MGQTILSASAFPAGLMVVCLVARWILVVGFGDFGTDYDLASRLAAGQWQGRDFFAVFPPLSGYSLLLFEKLIGQHYIVTNIHLWFWWLMNCLAAAALMRIYCGSEENVKLVTMAVALLTVPPNMHMVSFAYMASAFSGVSAFCLARHFLSGKKVFAILAGGAGGLAIMAKPNVGIAITLSLVAACTIIASLQRHSSAKYIYAGIMIVVGAAATIIVVVAIPGWYGGYGELAKEIFLGGSQIKGGFLSLAVRAIPRISTTVAPPLRYFVEFSITVPLLIVFFTLFRYLHKTRGAEKAGLPLPEKLSPEYARRLLWLLSVVVVGLSVWSIWPNKIPQRLVELFSSLQIVSLPFFLWQLFYLMIASALITSVIVGIRRRDYLNDYTHGFWLLSICLVWTLGIVASGRHNSIFTATIVAPVFIMQFNGLRGRLLFRSTILFLIVWTAAWHLAPNWKSTFARLTKLPEESIFSGLYWPENGACSPGSYPVWNSSEVIKVLQNRIAHRAEGKSILWLEPGPGAAFGGVIYRYGVHCLAPNNIPVWAERKFGAGVRDNPPELIVCARLDNWDDPKWSFMRPEVLSPWLHRNYNLIWEASEMPVPLQLWERRR